jgi:Tol biopolymer transport system component
VVQRFPAIGPSGRLISFSTYEGDKRVVMIAGPAGTVEKICDGCTRATAWSKDESEVLTFGESPYRIDRLDLATRKRRPVVVHPAYSLLYGRFSPDNRWVCFTARTSPLIGRIVIVPADGETPVPEESWIVVAEEGTEDRAEWAPDGNTLYFTSERLRYLDVWGRKLDPKTRAPIGEAFPVSQFHGARTMEKLGWFLGGGHLR